MRFLAFAVVLACGCASSKPATTARPPTPAKAPTVEPSDEELAKRGLVIVVDDRGGPPGRRVVFRALERPRAFQIEAHSVHVTSSTIGGRPGALNGKPITLDQRLELRTQPAGDRRVRCSLPTDGVEDEGSSCHFVRSANGGLSKIELLTGDQTTGDADDEGDGLTQHEAWPVLARVTLRLLSTPFPEDEIGPGARWQTWERVRVDHVWTRRHARYEHLGWTARGVRLAVTVDETAARQMYTGFEEAAEEARTMLADMEKQLGGRIEGTLTPEAQEAVSAAFPLKTLLGASQHARGEMDLDLDDALPARAKLEVKASYALEQPTVHASGEITRTIRVQRAP